MHRQTQFFRLTAAIAAASLLIGQATPLRAQEAAPAPDAVEQAPIDPPSLVGRVARLQGTVSFHAGDQDHWEPAQLNYPVTSGNAFWTQPGASADFDIGPSRAVLDQQTELDIGTLTDTTVQSTLAQGRVYVHVRDLLPGQQAQIVTPRGTVTLGADGRYAISAGDTESPTLVTVDSGLAQVSGPGVSLAVGPHQSARISGSETFNGLVGPELPDSFLAAQIAREQPLSSPVQGVAPPPVVQRMTGFEAVANTGNWVASPEYGQVWYPPVQAGWVPYRYGHWAWVSPWGWTWVDNAPWGFAPFHYGRWVEVDDRWGWVPVVPGAAVVVQPVYAPALVAFVGLGVGIGIGAAIGAGVGWIPLGPREVYVPSFRASPTFVRNVNVTNVTNINTITNVTNNAINNTRITNNRFVNAGAATVVPASAMTQSRPIGPQAQQLSPQARTALAAAQPIARPPVQPTLATQGVTPAVARSLNLPAASPGSIPPARVAPGPALQTRPRGSVPIPPPGGATPMPASLPQPGAATPRPGAVPGPVPSAIPPGGPQAAPGGAPSPSARPAGLPALPPRGGAPLTAAPGAAPGPVFTPRPGAATVRPAAPPGGAAPTAPLPGANLAPSPQPGAPAVPRPAPGPTPSPAPQIARPSPQPAAPQAPTAQPEAPPPAPGQAGALPVPHQAGPGPVAAPSIHPAAPMQPAAPPVIHQAAPAQPQPAPQPPPQAPRPAPAMAPAAAPPPAPAPVPQPRPQLQPQPQPQPQIARPQPVAPPPPAFHPQPPQQPAFHPQPPPPRPEPPPPQAFHAPPPPQPQPQPHQAPAAQKSCPPGHPNCT